MTLVSGSLLAAEKVFEVIGRWRRVDRQDLRRETGLDLATLDRELDALLKADLIESLKTPIDEFTIYILSPEGVRTYAQQGDAASDNS